MSDDMRSVGWSGFPEGTFHDEPASQAPSGEGERMEAAVRFLFGLLDDIDTASDMAKADERLYRSMVERIQKRRWETGITTDGYTLDLSTLADLTPGLRSHPTEEDE